MLYGSHHRYTSMPQNRRSHQLGKGHLSPAEMPSYAHPSRLVYGSQKLTAETLCEKRSHQLGKGQGEYAGMSVVVHPSLLVRERPQIRHRNDTVFTPFSISFMEVNNSQQRCHPDTTSRGKGQDTFAEMPYNKRPSQPVHRGHQNNAAMSFLSRLAREGSTKACNQQCQSFTTLPTSLWANRSTQKCYAESAHQLGKDIICTLIKPLLFLPFLLIYGSHRQGAAMLEGQRSHQFWAVIKTQQCHVTVAQF